MGFKFKALAAVWVSCFSMVSSQPTACTEDSQCSSGFYCEESAHYCRECLRCDELKRESPVPRELCVKSVLQCGQCFKGLVEDLRLDRACMEPAMQPDDIMPTYAWAIIGLMVLGVFLFVVILIALKKDTIFQHILKIRATTSASACTGGVSVPPSAPEMAPPPYDAVYAGDRAVSPDPPHPMPPYALDEELSRPFIKRLPSARARGARESADSQAAQPFNNPSYIRGPASSFVSSDESEPGSPFPPHDEETMDSPWTPNEIPTSHTVSNANGSGSLASTAPAASEAGGAGARRRAEGDAGPPSKAICLREDTNNNRGAAGHSGGGGAGPSVLINVVTNFNSFEQRNNVNLPNH